jgi:hypothetical protein
MVVPEAGKARDIAVRRRQLAPVLNGKGSMIRIRDQLAASARCAA